MTTYDFSVRRGTTFNGAEFTILEDGVAVDLTGSSALLQFRKDGVVTQELSLGSGLTLTAPASGKIGLDRQVFALVPGAHKYDILQILATGDRRIYIEGTATITEAQSVAT